MELIVSGSVPDEDAYLLLVKEECVELEGHYDTKKSEVSLFGPKNGFNP